MEQLKKGFPGTIPERQKKLDEVIDKLKEEFVGLDSILDQLKQSITLWYVTPELVKRPVVISLWGMTGTGKTSVVRRLLELLEVTNKSLFIDCGQEMSDSSSRLVDKVGDLMSGDDSMSATSSDRSLVFVFDEFQFAKTLDEDSCEVDKPQLRAIWSVMDSGKLNGIDSRYAALEFSRFAEDFIEFAKDYPDIQVEGNSVNSPDQVKLVLEQIGIMHYASRGIPGITESTKNLTGIYKGEDFVLEYCEGDGIFEEDEEEKIDDKDKYDPYRPLPLFENNIYRTIVKYYNSTNSDKSVGLDVIKSLHGCKTIGEMIPILEDAVRLVRTPIEYDVSTSLVFILGNLDEAFGIAHETNPDYDADVLQEITAEVTTADIKSALKKRFRAEQIARFGNNMIKYPSLGKSSFELIIKKEIFRIFKDLKTETGIDLSITNDIYDLIYAESVYPVQGVRPIFTTIGSLITPILSEVVVNAPHIDWKGKVLIELNNPEDNSINSFKIPETTVNVKYLEGSTTLKEFSRVILLDLGNLRNPKTRKSRHIISVHEAGHAIVFMQRTGVFPRSVVSTSTNYGGFCDTYNPNLKKEIDNREDIQSDVMISMAGYVAENIVFNDKSMHLLGSSSDFCQAWGSLSDAAYDCGYFTESPYLMSNYRTVIGKPVPDGLDSREEGLEDKIKAEYRLLIEKTEEYLVEEAKLLKEVSIVLSDRGSLTAKDLEDLVLKFGNKLTLESMRSTRNRREDYYEEVLTNWNLKSSWQNRQ